MHYNDVILLGSSYCGVLVRVLAPRPDRALPSWFYRWWFANARAIDGKSLKISQPVRSLSPSNGRRRVLALARFSGLLFPFSLA